MGKSTLIAPSLTVLLVLGLVAYRLLWAASSVAAAAGLGRFSKLPKGVRRWLFGEHHDAPKGWRELFFSLAATVRSVEGLKAIARRKEERMNQAIPVRTRPANVAMLAMLTVLALAIAPVCAPLCAAKTCSSGAGQCHEMANMGADGSERLVAPNKVCGASEFSAVLVKASGQSLLSPGLRNDPAQALINGSYAQSPASLRASPERWDVHRVPIKSANPLLLTTILRI